MNYATINSRKKRSALGGVIAAATDLRPLLEPWLASLAQRSECTARNRRVSVTRFLDELGDEELTPASLTAYTQSLTDLAVSSQAQHISDVRSFLSVCQTEGLIPRSPVEWLRRPKVTVSPHGKWLQLEELRALAKAARELGATHCALVSLLWTTGLRVSEAAGASWGDVFVDPVGRVGLRVLHAKGGVERQVRLLPETVEALATIRRGPHAGTGTIDPKDDSPLLPSPRGGAYGTWALWRKIKDAAEKAGIDRNVHPHSYRHSHATWAAAGDADVLTLMQSLGHRKAETTMAYVGLAKGLARTSTDHLPALD